VPTCDVIVMSFSGGNAFRVG